VKLIIALRFVTNPYLWVITNDHIITTHDHFSFSNNYAVMFEMLKFNVKTAISQNVRLFQFYMVIIRITNLYVNINIIHHHHQMTYLICSFKRLGCGCCCGLMYSFYNWFTVLINLSLLWWCGHASKMSWLKILVVIYLGYYWCLQVVSNSIVTAA
jgi:hypothetical protein